MKRLLLVVLVLLWSTGYVEAAYAPCSSLGTPGGGVCYINCTGSAGGDGTTTALSGEHAAWNFTGAIVLYDFAPDDQILFAKGDTCSGPTRPPSGTSGHPIVLGSYGSGAAPIIDGTGLYAIELDTKSNITIQDLDVRNGIYPLYAHGGTSNITIQRCTFTTSDGTTGVLISDDNKTVTNTNYTISNNTFSGNPGCGLAFSALQHSTISNNTAVNNCASSTCGAQCTWCAGIKGHSRESHANVIENNIVYGQHYGAGIWLDFNNDFDAVSGTAVIRYNKIYNNGYGAEATDVVFGSGIFIEITSGVEVYYNELYGNDAGMWMYGRPDPEPTVWYFNEGLNDMSIGGSFPTAEVTAYAAVIDGTDSPNTFKWSNNGGSTWAATGVAMTGSAQVLEADRTVTFAATTGHTMADRWDWTYTREGHTNNNLIANNTIHGSWLYGLLINGQGTTGSSDRIKNNVIKNNLVTGNLLTNLRMGGFAENAVNTILNNHFGLSEALVKQFELGWGAWSNTYAALNSWYANTCGGGGSTCGSNTNSVTSDPAFVSVSGKNFHLTAASPAINAGLDVGFTVSKGDSPIIGLPDLGVYEYSSPCEAGMACAMWLR